MAFISPPPVKGNTLAEDSVRFRLLVRVETYGLSHVEIHTTSCLTAHNILLHATIIERGHKLLTPTRSSIGHSMEISMFLSGLFLCVLGAKKNNKKTAAVPVLVA